MSILSKKRLLTGIATTTLAGLLLWTGGSLRAQNAPTPSPEEVSKQFVSELTGVSTAQRRYHSTIYYYLDKSGVISQKSVGELKSTIAPLMFNMANQIEEPHFKTQLSSSGEKIARVKVERDEISHPHDIVLLKEKGAWKVDVLATYAAWNKLDEVQAKKRIFAIFGAE